MKYLAPVANSLGWKLEESSAAMMAVADAGIKGSMGGQAFATSLARLAEPTKKMRKEMSRLGMDLFDANEDLKSMPEVIGELEKATKGFTSKQKASTLSIMFGAQAFKHWAVLLERGSGELKKMTTALEKADGTAAAMAADMINNLGGDWLIFKAGMIDAAYTVYKLFEPAMRGVLEAASKVALKLPAVIGVIAKLAKPFVPLAKAIGIAVLAVGSFLAAVAAFKLIGAALMLVSGPIWLVIGAIAALVLGFQMAYKHSESFRKALGGVGQSFKAISKIFNGEHKAAIDILEAAGFGPKQIDLIRKFGYNLKDTFTKVSGIVGGVSNIFAGKHKGAIDILSGVGFSPEQVDKIRAFGYSLKGAFDKVVGVFGGLGSLISTGDSTNLLAALGFSPEAIAGIFAFVENVKTKVGEFVTYLSAKWLELQPSIAMLLERFLTLKDTAISIFTTLWAFLQPIFGALGVAFQIIGDIAVMVWTNIIAPAINFVISMFQALWTIVGPILVLLGEAIGVAFGVLKIVWDTIIKPVAEYLMGTFAAAFEAAKPYVDQLSAGFEALGSIISTIAGWFNSFTNALSKFKVPSWLTSLGGGGTVRFEESSGGGGSKGKSHYHGIDYVPYNGYQATLHKGEKVVTAQNNRAGGSGGANIQFGDIHINAGDGDMEKAADEFMGIVLSRLETERVQRA